MLLRNINILVTLAVALLIEWALCLLDPTLLVFLAGALAAGEVLRAGRAFLIQKTDAHTRPVMKLFVIELLPYYLCLICLLATRNIGHVYSLGHKVPPPPAIWELLIPALFLSLPVYLLFATSAFFRWFWEQPRRSARKYIFLFGFTAAVCAGAVGLVFVSGKWPYIILSSRLIPLAFSSCVVWFFITINFSLISCLVVQVEGSPRQPAAFLKIAGKHLAILVVGALAILSTTLLYPRIFPAKYVALPGTPGSGNILILEIWRVRPPLYDSDRRLRDSVFRILENHHPIWRGRSWIYNAETETLTPQPWHVNYHGNILNEPVFHERARSLLVSQSESYLKSQHPLATLTRKCTLKIFNSTGAQAIEKHIAFSGLAVTPLSDASFMVFETDRNGNNKFIWNMKTGSTMDLSPLLAAFDYDCEDRSCIVTGNDFLFIGYLHNHSQESGLYALDMNTGQVSELFPSQGPFDISPDGKSFIIRPEDTHDTEKLTARFGNFTGKALIVSTDSQTLVSSFDSDALGFRFGPTGKRVAAIEPADPEHYHEPSINSDNSISIKYNLLKLVLVGTNGARQKQFLLTDVTGKYSWENSVPLLHWIDDSHILVRDIQRKGFEYREDEGLIVNITTGRVQSPRDIVRTRRR